MKNIFFYLIFGIGTMAVSAQEIAGVTVLEPLEYKKAISEAEVQLIDVRTPEEFSAGHIPEARNIDFLSPDFLEVMEGLDKNKPVYIYCRSGNRSGKASKQLLALGFEKVVDLEGGFLAWTESKKGSKP